MPSIKISWRNHKSLSGHTMLLLVISWLLWLAQKLKIFQDIIVPPFQITHQVRFSYEGNKSIAKHKAPRIVNKVSIDKMLSLGMFYA